MTQKPLFKPPPPTGNLTDRQRAAWDYLVDHPDGVSADEVGRLLHAERRKHASEQSCNWCAADGQGVLEALRAKGLAKNTRAKGWVALQAERTATDDEAVPWPQGF